MRRRDFITLLGGTAAWPLAAGAQEPGGMRRIGVLEGGYAQNNSEGQTGVAAIQNDSDLTQGPADRPVTA